MQGTYISTLPYGARIRPLLTTQFLGVFNDNAFKMLAILAVIGPQSDYFRDAAFMLAMTISYVMPFVLLTAPAGSLCDRFQKRYILIFSKLLELTIMILGAFCLGKAASWGTIPLLATMFLMTSQTAFFSPAYQGILPETFPERELSKANGDNGMISFIAAITGIGLSPLIYSFAQTVVSSLNQSGVQTPNAFFLSGIVLSILSIVGILASFRVKPTGEYESTLPQKERKHGMLSSLIVGWKALTERKSLLLSALGDAFFLGIGVAIQTLLVMFAKYGLKESGDNLELAALQLAPAIGMGLGCYFCGRISGGKIELGLVPYGAIGVAVFLPLAVYFPGSPVHFGGNSLLHLFALLWLCLAGIGGGFFVIPLRAFLQQNLKPAARGAALACSNALCFIAVLFSSIMVFLLMTGSEKLPEETPEIIRKIAVYIPSFTPSQLFFMLGIITLVITAYSMYILPDLVLRFGVVTLTHTLYRIRIRGAENIPSQGPVLLIANHVSLVDGLLITACTSRKIRFLMHEDFFQHPLIHPLAKITGFIEVPSHGRHKSIHSMFELVKEALRNGDVVCIFPEGKITRNGLIDDFKGGYAKMIPDDIKVPIVPLYLGMIWGSIFSYSEKNHFRMPREIPYPAAVSFGKPLFKEDVNPFILRQIVSELGADTEMTPRSEERPIHYQLAKNAKRHPFRQIIADYDGKSLTQFQALVASLVLSREIRKLVADSTQYVGVMLPNCTASAISMQAIMMADHVPTPLNFTASAETLRFSLKKAGITHILTSRKFLAKINREPLPEMVFLEDLAKGIQKKQKLWWAFLAIILPHQELMNLVAPVSHRNVFGPAVLLFSSGSTGEPKGILLSHRNINADCYSFVRVVNWTADERLLGNLPLFHSFGFTTGFWLPFMVQCKVVYVTSPLDSAMDGGALEKYRLSAVLATPTFMQAYMKRCTPEQFLSVRLAIVGAEKLRQDIYDKFKDFTGGRLSLIEGYGCTELSPIVTVNVGRSILELGSTIGRPGSIGAPMPGICVKIVDPVTGVELPPDTDGLLLVKGPNVMVGYLGDQVQTERAISSDGWYDTGDIARMDIDGYVTISGRLSRFSKIAGEMVPHEMLECVMNELCGKESRVLAVSGVPDPNKGEALVVLHTDEFTIPPEKMNSMLRERSIPNLWIPRTQNYWRVDHIPILGSGKLDMMNLNIMLEKMRKERES